jgi:hypothetical protein
VIAIYRFARAADDLADEGDATPPARLAALAAFDRALTAIGNGETPTRRRFPRSRRDPRARPAHRPVPRPGLGVLAGRHGGAL